MKRYNIPNIVLYFLGLNTICIGIIMILDVNFGISAATSVPTALYNVFDNISFGIWNYIGQSLAMIAVILIVKKVKVSYILSFLVGFVYALMLDFWSSVMAPIIPIGLFGRILFLVLGSGVLSFGVMMSMISKYPVLPFEMFVREIADYYKKSEGRVKIVFDVTMVLISMIISFFTFRDFRSVGPGTFFIALTGGPLMDFFNNRFFSYINGYFFIPEEEFFNTVEKIIIG